MKITPQKIVLFLLTLIALGVSAYLLVFFLNKPDSGEGIFSQRPLFPFRNNGGEIAEPSIENTQGIDSDEAGVIVNEQRPERPRVFKVTDKPVIAFLPITKERKELSATTDEEGVTTEEEITLKDLIVTFIDTRDGTNYEALVTNEEVTENMLSKITVPRSREGFMFGDQGQFMVLRYLNNETEQIETYLGERDTKKIPDQICRISLVSELKKGSKGDEVTQLQEILNYLYNSPEKIDGSFGAGVETIVKQYQQENNLEITGTIDSATRESFFDTCIEIETELSRKRREPHEINGSFFESDIHWVSISPNQDEIFYLTKTTTGSEGFIYSLKSQGTRRAFVSAFSEWIPVQWTGDSILLITAPSGYVQGFAYSVNTKTGEFKRLAGNINGLTALMSPNEDRLILGEGGTTGINLSLVRIGDISTSNNAPLSTLPEKCVWQKDNLHIICAVPQSIPEAIYPDDWYKGKVFFRDDIWRLDTSTGATERLVNASEFNESIDAINLILSPEEDFLFLRNRENHTLWGIEL